MKDVNSCNAFGSLVVQMSVPKHPILAANGFSYDQPTNTRLDQTAYSKPAKVHTACSTPPVTRYPNAISFYLSTSTPSLCHLEPWCQYLDLCSQMVAIHLSENWPITTTIHKNWDTALLVPKVSPFFGNLEILTLGSIFFGKFKDILQTYCNYEVGPIDVVPCMDATVLH